jgi:flagellar motor switch protein FliN
MTQSGKAHANGAWTARLGEVLAEAAGSQPVIREIPVDESKLREPRLWWRCSGAPPVFVGVSEGDATLLLQMRARVLAGETPVSARAGLADILDRTWGEIRAESPAEPASREVWQAEFPTGEKLCFVLAQTEFAQPEASNLDMLMDIELPITLRFGSTQMALRDIAGLSTGSVIEFDRGIDEPVDVMVNGHVVARGEAVVVQGSYGVRISEISSRRERLVTSSYTDLQQRSEKTGEYIG